ncbi:MAG: diguanylate cyclase [Candidatus Hydrogenedentes bacterium]|nr:diguanylate cyclase [Candidatus Hydrogenedentota bacterium]
MTTGKAEAEVASSAKNALSHMAKCSIALHPKNYTVWYGYFQGNNADLVRDINRLMELDRPLTDQVHDSLYDKYFASQHDPEVVERATDEARTIVTNILGSLLQATSSSAGYHDKLNALYAQLEGTKDLSAVQLVIGELMQHTKTMVSSTKELQQRLEAESARAESLQTQLENTKKEALKDSLTALFNRKALDKRLEETLEGFRETADSFSVLMLDVDHFKKVNDQHGHLVGDAVLRIVARSISEQIRGADFAARYGGEEFAVLLPKTSTDQAVIVAEHIRAAIENVRLEVVSSSELLPRITISIGVTSAKKHDNASSLFERADKALYLAKHTGRNRVKIAN